jgi:hypothetical protein
MPETDIEKVVAINQQIQLLEDQREALINGLKGQAIAVRTMGQERVILSGTIYDATVIWPAKMTGKVTHSLYMQLKKMGLHLYVKRKYAIRSKHYKVLPTSARELLNDMGVCLTEGSPRLIITPKKIAKLRGVV